MQIKIFITIAILVIVNTGLSSVVSSGDFEKGRIWRCRNIPAGWRVGLHNNPKAVIELDSEFFCSGKNHSKWHTICLSNGTSSKL